MKFKTLVLGPRHADTVRAALMLYASMLATGEPIPDHIRDIAAENGDRLSANEVNDLCERLNTAKEHDLE